MLNRAKFTKQFSHRLNELMRKAGYMSARVKNGIDIEKLAQISGCSYQMARRYALGEALPEIYIIAKIAAYLKSSPSWLLFGENQSLISEQKTGAMIEISPDLLKYILHKSIVLLSITDNKDELVNFLVDSIYDASHLQADDNMIYKIIDMMFLSTKFINNSLAKRK